MKITIEMNINLKYAGKQANPFSNIFNIFLDNFYLFDITFQKRVQKIKMDHHIQSTVELSKQQKIKKLNEKLDLMLKNKNVDPSKIQSKEELKAESQKVKNLNKIEEEEQEQEKKGDQLKNAKSKLIKKEEKGTNHNFRKVAGEVWEDKTMEDWPENDYRVFCGNLGNEVNDQILASVFKRYPSFQMARVVRDRRTGKTRGYGFVSFLNPNDFLNCLKQMNGKHVGYRPVKLMKSNWKDRDLNSAKNQFLPSDFKKNAQKTTHEICMDFKYVSSL